MNWTQVANDEYEADKGILKVMLWHSRSLSQNGHWEVLVINTQTRRWAGTSSDFSELWTREQAETFAKNIISGKLSRIITRTPAGNRLVRYE